MKSANTKRRVVDSSARKAILSLAESGPHDITDFESFLDDNQFTPVGRIRGFPIYRARDAETEDRCYIIDERSSVLNRPVSSIDFDVRDGFLVIMCSYETNAAENFLVSLAVLNVVVQKLECPDLTRSELKVTAQLLSGMTLERSAETDGLSVETKRSQIKSVLSKLGLSRQIDAVRVLLPELLLLVDVRNWDHERQRLFNEYANRFLADRVRCQRIVDRNGASVRIVDFGPQRGSPILVLHSMIFPDITEEDIDFAYDNNIRLIWPLRPGLLETAPIPRSAEDYSQETHSGINLAWEHLCGEPVPVIAMVSSAWHATEFAEQYPGKVKHISYAATCFSAGKYENSLVYFGSGVVELCSRNTWLMTKTIDFLKKRVETIENFKKTITLVFSKSDPDIEVLEREFEAPFHGHRLKMAIVDSPESVKHDFFNQIHFSWDRVGKLKAPVAFIHGRCDSMHPVDDLQRLLSRTGDPELICFEKSGHLLQYEHFHSLLQTVLAWESRSSVSQD